MIMVVNDEIFFFLLKTEHKLVITMIGAGLCLLYTPFLMRQPNRAQDMERK